MLESISTVLGGGLAGQHKHVPAMRKSYLLLLLKPMELNDNNNLHVTMRGKLWNLLNADYTVHYVDWILTLIFHVRLSYFRGEG